MKKTSSRGISGRANNKEAMADTKTVRAASKATVTEKRDVTKSKAKNSGRRKAGAGGKCGAKAGIKKKKESANAPIQKKTKTSPQKPIVRRKEKPVSTKKGAPRYVPKKKGKVVAEGEKKTKGNSEKAERVAAGAKKLPVGKGKKINIKQAAEKHRTKTGVEVKRKTTDTSETALKKYSRETVRKVGTKRIVERAEKRIRPGIKQIEDVYPSAASVGQPAPWETLPAEYGENGVTLMPVDPHKLFVFWEVREDAMKSHEGDLTIRVYDIVGDGFNSMDADSYFDIAARERMGRQYIDVRPAKAFIADIGISHEGIFIAIARSSRVSTPCAGISPVADLSRKLPENDNRVGY